MTALIDTHLHLARDEFDADRDEVLVRAREAGVGAFLHVGFDPESIDGALELAHRLPASWATAGLHPHDASGFDEAFEARLRQLAAEGRIVAIGECGLDYFRDLSPRDVQSDVFRRQIRLATELDLPMIFHVRDAYEDARTVLEETGLPPRRGVFHAFAGDAEFARWATSHGFKLGIGGPLTYKNAALADSIVGLSHDSFLLETDAPWLPPQPWRGKRNEPSYLHHTARRLSEICGISLDELAEQSASTFSELFRVELPEELRAIHPGEHSDPAGYKRKSQGGLLRERGIKLSKSLGQHFLKDPNVVERIATAIAELKPKRVVEMGSGAGALSFALLDRGWPVHALELDERMIQLLREESKGRALHVERADLAQTDFVRLLDDERTVFAGNLPYQVTSSVLFGLLPTFTHPSMAGAVVMMQAEVARRLAAGPGGKEYGVLSVLVQAYCEVEPLFTLKPGAFLPPPKVDSAVVRLVARRDPVQLGDDGTRLVKDLFQQRRKQLGGLLRRRHRDADIDVVLTRLGLDSAARPESLSIEQFAQLALALRGERPSR